MKIFAAAITAGWRRNEGFTHKSEVKLQLELYPGLRPAAGLAALTEGQGDGDVRLRRGIARARERGGVGVGGGGGGRSPAARAAARAPSLSSSWVQCQGQG